MCARFAISDHCGDTAAVSVTVTQPTPVTIDSVTVTRDVSCHDGRNGAFTFDVGGGTAPYAYSLTLNGYSMQPVEGLTAGVITVDNVGHGSYTIAVTDANGCMATATVTILEPSQPLTLFAEISTLIACYDATATVTLHAAGGTGLYTYVTTTGGGEEGSTSGEFVGVTGATDDGTHHE
jgi:hypothetical protein